MVPGPAHEPQKDVTLDSAAGSDCSSHLDFTEGWDRETPPHGPLAVTRGPVTYSLSISEDSPSLSLSVLCILI